MHYFVLPNKYSKKTKISPKKSVKICKIFYNQIIIKKINKQWKSVVKKSLFVYMQNIQTSENKKMTQKKKNNSKGHFQKNNIDVVPCYIVPEEKKIAFG